MLVAIVLSALRAWPASPWDDRGSPDVARVLEGGYSTGQGFGRGLCGASPWWTRSPQKSSLGKGIEYDMRVADVPIPLGLS